MALAKVGVRPEEAVFTGDTVWDVQAWPKAAVPCIGLLSGGISLSLATASGNRRQTPVRRNRVAASVPQIPPGLIRRRPHARRGSFLVIPPCDTGLPWVTESDTELSRPMGTTVVRWVGGGRRARPLSSGKCVDSPVGQRMQ